MPHRRRQRLQPREKMLAYCHPDVDWNTCWVCKTYNPSYLLDCHICEAPITPTCINHQNVAYRIFSFGSRAHQFDSCQKLHASLLEEAVQVLQDETQIAVRVGVDSECAVLIKDADGGIRSSTTEELSSEASTQSASNEVTTFLEASRKILDADLDKTTGKVFPLRSCY